MAYNTQQFENNSYCKRMFSEFQSMIKEKINSIKNHKDNHPSDVSKVPQKYLIQGKHIQELKLLSEGSFGFIWLAEDVTTKQKMALKRIVCITKERFHLAKQQLQLMMKLPKSKYLVSCFGGELVTLKSNNSEIKVMIILMQYCSNGTLFTLLQKRENKGFTEQQLIQIMASVFQGIKAIHQAQCYHQDIKLENVLIGEDKAFKICDFGSCSNRVIDFSKINKSEYESIKEEIEAVTTPMYRPPEIVDPYKGYQVGPKVDVWMAGCILYTLAYFTHPFVDSNAVGIVNGVYRFPKYPQQSKYKTTDKINDLIRHLLTPNPTFRPSVQEFLSVLYGWNTIKDVPLNKQAQRMKKEYLQKQKQMQKINQNLIGVDEEIPMERLLQLQQKIREKMKAAESNTSFIPNQNKSFIPVQNKNSKQMVLPDNSKQQNRQENSNKSISFSKPVEKSNVQQKTVDFDSFWNIGTTTAPKITNNNTNSAQFDQFASFFATSNPQPPNNTHSPEIFDYFIVNEPKNEQKLESIPPQKSKEQNLLDL